MVRRVRRQVHAKHVTTKTKPALLLVRFYCHQVPPRGFQHLPILTTLQAVHRVLARPYHGIPLPSALQPNKTQKQSERNLEIRQRHAAGETIRALAQAFGISKQRVHQIITDPES